MGIDETGAEAVVDEIRMRQDRRQEGNVGGDAADPELTQGARRLVHDVGPVAARRMHDDLGEQRVEGGAGPVAGVTKGIDANAGAGRQVEQGERSAGRPGPAGLVHHLHIDAELHRVAARFRDIGLRQTERAQRGASRDRELRLHEIEAEYLLGDGMLDLKPRIGLDEGKRLVARLGVVIDEKFEGAEIVVVRGGREFLGGVDDAPAQGVVQRRARRDLDEFLVAALDRAFALPQMADGAMVVADDLHLDVAGVANQALDIDAVAAESRLGLGLAARIGLLELRGVIDDAHAASAAAGDGLDHHGATGTQRCKESPGLFQAGRPAGAFDDRHAASLRQRLGLRLVAEQIQRLRRWPDKDDAFLDAAPGECGILAEEAIAGMQRIAAGRLRSRYHRLDIEIGPRATPGNLVGGIGGAGMHRLRIVGGIDRNRGEPGVTRGARDANGDLAAVGDQQLMEGHRDTRWSLFLSMISAQTRFAFVARENRYPLFRIML